MRSNFPQEVSNEQAEDIGKFVAQIARDLDLSQEIIQYLAFIVTQVISMTEHYQKMLNSERLILSPQRHRKYFEAVIVGAILTAVIVGFDIYILIKRPGNFSVLLVILIPLLFTIYTYHHQSSRLKFRKIVTKSNININRRLARACVEELGWKMAVDNDAYMEATVPFLGAETRYSQLIVILNADCKILIASISHPDMGPVQGGWSFGKHKRNIEQIANLFQDLELENEKTLFSS